METNFLIGDPTVIPILKLSKDVINDGLDYDHLLVSFDYRPSYRIFMGTLLLIPSLITSSWIQTSFSFLEWMSQRLGEMKPLKYFGIERVPTILKNNNSSLPNNIDLEFGHRRIFVFIRWNILFIKRNTLQGTEWGKLFSTCFWFRTAEQEWPRSAERHLRTIKVRVERIETKTKIIEEEKTKTFDSELIFILWGW